MTYESEAKAAAEAIKAKQSAHEAALSRLQDRIVELEQRGASLPVSAATGAKSLAATLIADSGIAAFKARQTKAAGASVQFSDLLTKSSPPSLILNDGQTLSDASRLPGIVGGMQRQMWLRERMPQTVTGSSSIEFTAESAFVNEAGSQAGEGAEKARSEFAFTLENRPVQTLAHFVVASRQVLDDSPALGAFLDQRLRYGLELEAERQLIGGDPAQHELTGVTRSGQHVAFTPSTGDTAIDSIRRAIAELQSREFLAPPTVVLNPLDWAAIELEKDEDKQYVAGQPRGGANTIGATLWGADVHVTPTMQQGKFVCADFVSSCLLWVRQDALVEMSQHDGENFQRNLVTVRCEARMSLSVLRPAGISYGNLTQ